MKRAHHLGAIRSMVAAQVQGARRYIMLCSMNNDINSQSPIAHYHRAKAHADNHLAETDLDYTIRRSFSILDGNTLVTAALSALK